MTFRNAQAHQGIAAVEGGLHKKGAAGLVKADCNVGAQALTQHQHRLEVLQVEGHVFGLTGVVSVV